MDYQHLMLKANQGLGKVKQGQEFLVKELFQGTEWSNLTNGERRSFGRHFKNEVLDGKVPGVEFIKKADNNSSKYRRV